MGHSNAPLTPEGRRRLCERVDAGRAICHVAAEAGIARQTLGKWYERWITEGEQGLVDRSSRPECSPNQTAVHIEDRVEALRRERKLGPVQLMAGETIHLVWSEGSVLNLRPAETIKGPFTIRYDERRHGLIPSEDEVWVMRAPDQFKWATVLMPD